MKTISLKPIFYWSNLLILSSLYLAISSCSSKIEEKTVLISVFNVQGELVHQQEGLAVNHEKTVKIIQSQLNLILQKSKLESSSDG